jgi:hypothetical protein
MSTSAAPVKPLEFHLTVLGRTLEHLGVQMYKRREPAIAELIANCWDAGAKTVRVFVPEKEEYDPLSSTITILDDGSGMNPTQIQNEYLVVGRNRRSADHDKVGARPIMGRKGIGKLAGFGIANTVEIITWQGGAATYFKLEIDKLKTDDDTSKRIPITGEAISVPAWVKSASGTSLVLRDLKHKTAIDVLKLREALARRFSTRVRGEMEIFVNGDPLGEPNIELGYRNPPAGFAEEEIAPGQKIRFFYGFSKTTIKSPELRGFTIYAHGKTAQAPPFFFNVEATASGQHGTKYVTGAIEADFLDDSTDEKQDVISTDRQDIDWEVEQTKELLKWGSALARKALRECAEYKGKEMHDWILSEPAIAERVARLDPASKKHVSRFLTILGQAEPDRERGLELGDAIVRAFEYRHFHDVVSELDEAAADPERFHELVSKLREWKVLESRAVLEIINGRLQIVDRLQQMILDSAPETASKLSKENFHDLIGAYPWVLNPEWQIFEEEKRISTLLNQWGAKDISNEDELLRIDFLALTNRHELVIVELKRPSHPVSSAELLRLLNYREQLAKAFHGPIRMLLVYGGTLDVSGQLQGTFTQAGDSDILTWSEIYGRAKDYYEHYRTLLKGEVANPDFVKKITEVLQVRTHIPGGIYRGPAERKLGIGPQDKDNRRVKTIGILGYGSLLFDLSQEIKEAIGAEKDTITPFRVEYARSSDTRGGGPTLVPVKEGGSQVTGKIFVLKDNIGLNKAKQMLGVREGIPASNTTILLGELPDFNGVDHVIYGHLPPNLGSPDAVTLAALAIESVKKAKAGKDGITYLNEMIKRSVITPLTAEYQSELLKSTQTKDLDAALAKLKET